MIKIKEAYVSFEVAKLLKEKGNFNVPCLRVYDKNGIVCIRYSGFDIPHNYTNTLLYLCPTHQMAMAWLRERYNLFFGTGFGNDCNGKFLYMIDIYDLTNNAVNGKYKPIVEADDYLTDNPKTYEDAVEAALKYTLENLI